MAPLQSFIDVTDLSKFHRVPDDWSLVITDVEGSTKAIESGRYKDVNAVGAATIVAVQNALADRDFPYVFGGDGATLLLPTAALDSLGPTLRGVRRRARDGFDLGLRVGVVPVVELGAAGHTVLVARLMVSEFASFAMLAGDGISAAEKWVKDPERGARYAIADDGPASVDLEGFECRWQPLPAQRGMVASILIHATGDAADASRAYRAVLLELDSIVQGAAPVSQAKLMLASDPLAFHQEASLRGGRPGSLGYRLRRFVARFENGVGRQLVKKHSALAGFDGARYPDQVVLNSDYRKFDDTLRMVLDVTAEELARIEGLLEAHARRGELVFGVHTADAALMTCIVRKYEGEHIHFVDGANGGYALAAKRMKESLRSR